MTEEQRRYHRDWHRNRSQAEKTRKTELQKKRRNAIRKQVQDLKASKGCSRCQESDPRCLDFHHLDGKTFNIGDGIRLGRGLKSLTEEMGKCIILCANCHRKETFS